MATESIISSLKPGYPKKGVSSGSYDTELVYVGDYTTLLAASPGVGNTWGLYEGRVSDANVEPVPGTTKGELSVKMSREFQASSDGGGAATADEITYEIDWMVVNRPLIEHPEFRTSGTYYLDASELAAIAIWEADKTDANYSALATNPQKYADGILLGISTFDDYAPTVRVTTGYINGKPPIDTVGAKGNPPTESDFPAGYEYVKSADRGVKAGKKNRWQRVEEWTGAKKVLVDNVAIFY